MSDGAPDARAEWLRKQIQEFKRIEPLLEQFAVELGVKLQSAADAHAPLAIVKTRVKNLASFADKALLKREKYTCPVHQFTDLVGGRVIVRTHREVAAISRVIRSLFKVDEDNSLDASSRLDVAQFGYGSIHYIVSFDHDPEPDQSSDVFGFTCSICEKWNPHKGEIQVRTIAQHAYADFSHDISYKGGFTLPFAFRRRLGVIAAQLEDVDSAFTDIEHELVIYTAIYGRYMTPAQRRERIDHLCSVLAADDQDQPNDRLHWEIGSLVIEDGDLEKARRVFEDAVDGDDIESAHPPSLRDLGRVLCDLHPKDRNHAEARTGRQYLEKAVDLDPTDTYAMCLLGNQWRGIDEDCAGDWYRKAFNVDPSDAYALTRYLQYEVGHRDNLGLLNVVAPLASRAIERCDAHISVEINLPWALYQKGELLLLSEKPYEALDAYAQAIMKSADASPLDEALDGLAVFGGITERIPGVGWIVDLLDLARRVRFQNADESRAEAKDAEVPASTGPVVIVAGGTGQQYEAEIGHYRARFEEAFADFKGTVISGGTADGVAGFVAELAADYPERISAVGYLSKEADASGGYSEVYCVGTKFSPHQSLQAWSDIIEAGMDPKAVKVLGIGGGRIAAAEYRIATVLGAYVGILESSGRAADTILADPGWSVERNLIRLPDDPQTLRGFIGSGSGGFDEDVNERLAIRIHDAYCDKNAAEPREVPDQERPWPELGDTYKNSNLLQATHIEAKLRRIGYEVVPLSEVTEKFEGFTDAEVELLAEMEHGRWNAERLADGWTYGTPRDNDKKIHDKIVPWTELDDETRNWDREPVLNIPTILKEEHLGIRRIVE